MGTSKAQSSPQGSSPNSSKQDELTAQLILLFYGTEALREYRADHELIPVTVYQAVQGFQEFATTLAEEASRTARMDELKLLQNFLVKHHLYDQDAAMKLNYHFKERLAELAPQKESE